VTWTSSDRSDPSLARCPAPGEALPTSTDDIVTVDETAYIRALAHPLRMRILAMLEERPSSPGRLAEALGSNAKVVDYHVKRLVRLGLAGLVETRRSRGAPSTSTPHVRIRPSPMPPGRPWTPAFAPGWSSRRSGRRASTRTARRWPAASTAATRI